MRPTNRMPLIGAWFLLLITTEPMHCFRAPCAFVHTGRRVDPAISSGTPRARGPVSRTLASTAGKSVEAKSDASRQREGGKADNKAMAFLRKIGKVGGNRDFRYAVGVDEGVAGKSAGMKPLKKSKHAYQSCSETGIVDDMSESFPTTTTGTSWSGYTDQVMGGMSTGSLAREVFHGRVANVMRGKVRLENNGGFVQMAANLASQGLSSSVDASSFDGVELEVLNDGENDSESFNVHLKTNACERPYSSYRATFDVPRGEWKTVRIPWESFRGHGPGASEAPFDTSRLTRVGIVAIGREMTAVLALSSLKFYSSADGSVSA